MRCITVLAMALFLHTQACRDSNAQEARTQQRAQTPAPAPRADSSSRFVSHVEHVQPGGMAIPRGMLLRNPYEGNATVAATGAKLFIAYNCIDCHGADGSGAMGPSLADGRWHFGGTAAEVYESIYQGRPEGMPAWGSLLSSDQIWTLVTYVRSLEKGKNVTTENFGGATVERTGH
jgi:cytochrome c oxidase cbb3-type subunit 3